MAVFVEQSEKLFVIRMEGELGMHSAPMLKSCVLQALASEKDIRLDLQLATEVDLTVLQLLWVAAQQAKGAHRELRLRGEIPANIALAALDAGFLSFPVPAESKQVRPDMAVLRA